MSMVNLQSSATGRALPPALTLFNWRYTFLTLELAVIFVAAVQAAIQGESKNVRRKPQRNPRP